jgi:aerotaxis receptor
MAACPNGIVNNTIKNEIIPINGFVIFVKGIAESDGLNQQIAAASEQQSQTVSQLNEEIHDIHQLAIKTSEQLQDTVEAGQAVGYHVGRQQLLVRHLVPGRRG